jgi:hypothetical protein
MSNGQVSGALSSAAHGLNWATDVDGNWELYGEFVGIVESWKVDVVFRRRDPSRNEAIGVFEPFTSSFLKTLEGFKTAGYRYGEQPLPTYGNILNAGDAVWGANAVVAGGTIDQAPKLNAIIASIKTQSGRSFANGTRLVLPPGVIVTRSPILLDCDYLILDGNNAATIQFEPSADTKYDSLSQGTAEADDFDLSLMTYAQSNGGWIFPGRAAIRIGPTAVQPSYDEEYVVAPANRKDFYHGSVNFPWKSGLRVAQTAPYIAQTGDTVIPLEAEPASVYIDSWITVFAANTKTFYNSGGTTNPLHHRGTPVVRTRMHRVIAKGPTSVTVWPPLEFPLPRNQEADGDVAIDLLPFPSSYYSMIVPLQITRGSGVQGLAINQTLPGFTAGQATYNYTNLAADQAMLGVLLRWSVDCFIKNITTSMTGSHPIATEFVSNCTISGNTLNGSWNKGAGGNGYLRISKAWNCLIENNSLANLRHLTLQWSASTNVVRGNTTSADINLHGGWERLNLIEDNTANIPFEHRYGTPSSADPSAGSNWYPLWWGAGPHAGRWSSASGEVNTVHNNILTKQIAAGGPFLPALYSIAKQIYIFGSKANQWTHLAENGVIIPTWGQREAIDFTALPNSGVEKAGQWATSLYTYAKALPVVRPVMAEYPGVEGFAISSSPNLRLHLSPTSTVNQTAGSIDSIVNPIDSRAILAEATNKPTIAGPGSWRFNSSRLNLAPADISRQSTWVLNIKNDLTTTAQGRILDVRIGNYAMQLYPQTDYTRLQFAIYKRVSTTWSFLAGVTAGVGECPKGFWRVVCVNWDMDAQNLSMQIFGHSKRSTTYADVIPATADVAGAIGWRLHGTANHYLGNISRVIRFDRLLTPHEQWSVCDRVRFEGPYFN